MRYPEFLKDNGTIGIVSPSLAAATEPYISLFDSASARFNSLGYRVAAGPLAHASEGIGISSTPEKCAAELNEYYLSKDCDIIISNGGGEMMCEILPYVDFDAMKQAKPKWYMGYSDNTNFVFPSTAIMDTAAIYGSCFSGFGQRKMHASAEDALALLRGKKLSFSNYDMWELSDMELTEGEEEDPLAPYNLTEPFCLKSNLGDDPHAEFSGRLIGGCTDCLSNLIGTDFDQVKAFNEKYKDDGIIWFLESCDLNVFDIRRTMWHMKQAGWFEHVKGFLIGRPGCHGQELFGLDQYKAITDIVGDLNVPIIMDLDFGHKPPRIPIISGSIGHVKVDGNHFHITYELV